MKRLYCARIMLMLVGYIIVALLTHPAIGSDSEGVMPIADAGSSRYVAQDPVILDGNGSYDPDSSGPLSYMWQQIAGPSVVITDANTASPTISGFIQTDEIQECEFELVVSDGELTSLPDTVKVIIVPAFGANTMRQLNPPFDPNKPTLVVGAGGPGVPWEWSVDPTPWYEKANMINFGPYSFPYKKYGDMAIVYLSTLAPDYKQPIQTLGHSAGVPPTIELAIHLNVTYADPRYAVNRVTIIDSGSLRGLRGQGNESIAQFLTSYVDGEQCWIDNYIATNGKAYDNVLNLHCPSLTHTGVRTWYEYSLAGSDMNRFNNGVIAGAYWSVAGPGKNLQLASTPGEMTYVSQWHGTISYGHMDFHDESTYPARLPEPVTLLAWRDSLDSKGVVLSCKESENAVGYELLLGHDPYRIVDFNIVSDTAIPPTEVIKTFPFEETWWTIRARDQHGSTIYADPMRIDLENLPWATIENLTTGQTYGYIQAAIDHAVPGDEIVIGPGTYLENINFKGKNLMIRSTNPDDPATVAATVINGGDQGTVVTLSGSRDGVCILAGLTITGGEVGISCGDASPTIRNCTIESNGPNAIEFRECYEPPTIIDCTIIGKVAEVEVYHPRLVALWKMDETDGSIAYDSIGVNDGICHGDPLWQPADGKVGGALQLDGIDDYVSTPFILNPAKGPFSAFAWIKGGSPGQVVISQIAREDWLLADAEGKLMTTLRRGSLTPALASGPVITDGDWHHIGVVWDGSHRHLYVDGTHVAEDATDILYLRASNGGLYIGADKNLEAGIFFSGLIDDVRIYDVALNEEEIASLTQ